MGVPTSEVGYTPVMPRREDHEVHKGHVVALDKKKKTLHTQNAAEFQPNVSVTGIHRLLATDKGRSGLSPVRTVKVNGRLLMQYQ